MSRSISPGRSRGGRSVSPGSRRIINMAASYGTDMASDALAPMPEFDEPDIKIEAYIAEFLGTFFLVLTVGFNVLQKTALAPVSIGAILMAMIFSTGKVSGGHFNPAVTLAVHLRGGDKIVDDVHNVVGYMACQALGGIVAGLVYLAVLGATFSLGPGVGYGLGSVLIVEAFFTAALVFVVLNVATTKQDEGNWYFGLAIGFTVMAAAFAIGPISGCSLNPAVSIGVMISNFIHTGQLRIFVLLLYVFTPFVGSMIGYIAFQVIREAEFNFANTFHAKSMEAPARVPFRDIESRGMTASTRSRPTSPPR